MKAVIVAAGNGNRFGAGFSKCLFDIHDGKPLISYTIDRLLDIGVRDIAVVVRQKLPFLQHLHEYDLTYIIQSEPKGIAHAMMQAADFVGDNRFFLLYGDMVVPKEALQNAANCHNNVAMVTVSPEPEKYGVVHVDQEGFAYRVEEKPEGYVMANVSVGGYKLTPDAMEIAMTTLPSARGELEITDVVNTMMESKKFSVVDIEPTEVFHLTAIGDLTYIRRNLE